jgi:hypothetical protein
VITISAILVGVAAVLVALTLDRDPPPVYSVTPPRPMEVGDRRVGPLRVTVDATDPDRWAHFDFSRGSVVPDPAPGGWDLAFRRFEMMTNGGTGFPGRGAAMALDAVPPDSVGAVPDSQWVMARSEGDSVNPALARWYDYGFISHLLTPRPRTYVVRTADGRWAALRFLSYYCPGPTPGCVTFEYVYHGDGIIGTE